MRDDGWDTAAELQAELEYQRNLARDRFRRMTYWRNRAFDAEDEVDRHGLSEGSPVAPAFREVAPPPLAESDCTCEHGANWGEAPDPNCPVHGDKGPERRKADLNPFRRENERLRARAETAEARETKQYDRAQRNLDRAKAAEAKAEELNRHASLLFGDLAEAGAKLEAVREEAERGKRGGADPTAERILSLLAQEESE